MRVLIVDNRDSFTYNLVEYVRTLTGHRPTVVVHDTPWASLDPENFDCVIISPGPGSPSREEDVGLSADVLRHFQGPVLGVCLGMQLMVEMRGGSVGLAPEPMHGRTSSVAHDGTGLFEGIPTPYEVVRYHSLVAHEVPESLRVNAWTVEDELPMAVVDVDKPWWGVQFHPESIGDEWGLKLVENFLDLVQRLNPADRPFSVRTLAHDEVPEAADLERIARGLRGNRFWLDCGRFSLLGDDSGPRARYLAWDLETQGKGFFGTWQAAHAEVSLPHGAGHPVPGCDFALGWVGYLGYEMGQECGMGSMPAAPGPDAEFVFADRCVIVDHESHVTHLVAFAGDDEWELPLGQPRAVEKRPESLHAVHNRAQYISLIERAQEFIRWGETYELCLTNRVEFQPVEDMLSAFVELRGANPSQRTGYMSFVGNELASTSPELFIKVNEDSVVTSKPIKGTRPRHIDDAQDEAARADLATNPKDRSENLMIVDLVRNDLSRVCTDIRVPTFGAVESYATVHQLVSTVTGRLENGHNAIDALRACFPGGSMTGAPKYRTMQLISELEGTWRGVYSGTYGYLSLSGAADFSMVIRTVVNGQQGAYYGVGGAILALSNAAEEYEETVTKARPLTNFLGVSIDEHR